VSKLFDAMPPKLTAALVKTVAKTNDAAITAAFVAKINQIKVPEVNFRYPNAPQLAPGGGGFLTTPPKTPPNPKDWALGSPFPSPTFPSLSSPIEEVTVIEPPKRVSSASGSYSDVAINAPITINQQPGQNADELASIVAMKIGEAMADARASSLFV